MNLSMWIKEERGRSFGLARVLGVRPPVVSNWCRGVKPIPLERAYAIERHTQGAVTRRDMFPQSWGLIWPELIDADHPWQPHMHSVGSGGDGQ